ncbi:hypothetical protein [Synechococcus sp. Cu2B8-bc1011]|uniref:hypothetical protein n=1 Tax=Synechococcus sp. Cu2B8-bc1011 TaxID=3093725 RepID=UPI0039AFADC2
MANAYSTQESNCVINKSVASKGSLSQNQAKRKKKGGRFTQPPQLENPDCQQQPLKAQDLSEVS